MTKLDLINSRFQPNKSVRVYDSLENLPIESTNKKERKKTYVSMDRGKINNNSLSTNSFYTSSSYTTELNDLDQTFDTFMTSSQTVSYYSSKILENKNKEKGLKNILASLPDSSVKNKEKLIKEIDYKYNAISPYTSSILSTHPSYSSSPYFSPSKSSISDPQSPSSPINNSNSSPVKVVFGKTVREEIKIKENSSEVLDKVFPPVSLEELQINSPILDRIKDRIHDDDSHTLQAKIKNNNVLGGTFSKTEREKPRPQSPNKTDSLNPFAPPVGTDLGPGCYNPSYKVIDKDDSNLLVFPAVTASYYDDEIIKTNKDLLIPYKQIKRVEKKEQSFIKNYPTKHEFLSTATPSFAQDTPLPSYLNTNGVSFSKEERVLGKENQQECYYKTTGLLLSHNYDKNFTHKPNIKFENKNSINYAIEVLENQKLKSLQKSSSLSSSSSVNSTNRPKSTSNATPSTRTKVIAKVLMKHHEKIKNSEKVNVIDSSHIDTLVYNVENSPIKYSYFKTKKTNNSGSESEEEDDDIFIIKSASTTNIGPGSYEVPTSTIEIKRPEFNSTFFYNIRSPTNFSPIPENTVKLKKFNEENDKGPLLHYDETVNENKGTIFLNKIKKIYPNLHKKIEAEENPVEPPTSTDSNDIHFVPSRYYENYYNTPFYKNLEDPIINELKVEDEMKEMERLNNDKNKIVHFSTYEKYFNENKKNKKLMKKLKKKQDDITNDTFNYHEYLPS